jgi:hypothetical protein
MGAKMNYDSSGKWVQQDVFALASKFADLVEKQPARFNPTTKWWENIKREEILTKLLERAATQVARKQDDSQIQAAAPTQDEWANWLGISKWAISQKQSCDAVARFLGKALESNHPIPDAYFLEFPQLFSSLIEKDDSRLTGNNDVSRDWLTIAINSTRGDAIQALLDLALRQKNAGKEIEPWIFELISKRLQLPEESPAIFALLGSRLRFVIHLFEGRIKESPLLLLPPDKPSHRAATLVAHFKYDRPWNLILKTFPRIITAALQTLKAMPTDAEDNEAKQNRRDFGLRLGIHIVSYYWSSSFPSDSDGEATMDQFFAIAGNSTRAALISHIATIWEKHAAEADDKTIVKVMRIWERRFAQITQKIKGGGESNTDFDGELAEFTDWLHCECFPFEWRSSLAKQAVGQLRKAPHSHRLLEAISKFGVMPDRLRAMLEIFRELLKRPSDELRWSIQFKDVSPVIALGLASDNPDTKKNADECRDSLLKMGFSDFLNLDVPESGIKSTGRATPDGAP